MTGAVHKVLSGRWTWKASKGKIGSAATRAKAVAALRQAMAT